MARDLLTLTEITPGEVMALLDEAQAFRDKAFFPTYPERWHVTSSLKLQPAPRTVSASQKKMGMRVVSFHPEQSSMNKDESFDDTVRIFYNFGVDALVIRHPDNAYCNQLRGHVMAPFLNDGDGTGNHPTQSLPDVNSARRVNPETFYSMGRTTPFEGRELWGKVSSAFFCGRMIE